MKLDEMFPRKYLSGTDLQGKHVTVTIARVVKEKMYTRPGEGPQDKYVVFFDGKEKGLILGKLIASQIAKAVGSDDTQYWTGKRVVLYPESVTVGGQPYTAIRVRAADDHNPQG